MVWKGNKITYSFQHNGPSVIRMDFSPFFSIGSKVKDMRLSGEFETKSPDFDQPLIVYMDQNLVIEFELESCIGVLPQITYPKPGDRSKGVRIVNEQYSADTYEIQLEGLSETKAEIEVYMLNHRIDKIKNGKLLGQQGNIFTFEVEFGNGESMYQPLNLILQLR